MRRRTRMTRSRAAQSRQESRQGAEQGGPASEGGLREREIARALKGARRCGRDWPLPPCRSCRLAALPSPESCYFNRYLSSSSHTRIFRRAAASLISARARSFPLAHSARGRRGAFFLPPVPRLAHAPRYRRPETKKSPCPPLWAGLVRERRRALAHSARSALLHPV